MFNISMQGRSSHILNLIIFISGMIVCTLPIILYPQKINLMVPMVDINSLWLVSMSIFSAFLLDCTLFVYEGWRQCETRQEFFAKMIFIFFLFIPNILLSPIISYSHILYCIFGLHQLMIISYVVQRHLTTCRLQILTLFSLNLSISIHSWMIISNISVDVKFVLFLISIISFLLGILSIITILYNENKIEILKIIYSFEYDILKINSIFEISLLIIELISIFILMIQSYCLGISLHSYIFTSGMIINGYIICVWIFGNHILQRKLRINFVEEVK